MASGKTCYWLESYISLFLIKFVVMANNEHYKVKVLPSVVRFVPRLLNTSLRENLHINREQWLIRLRRTLYKNKKSNNF
jgi:hypothetical protein